MAPTTEQDYSRRNMNLKEAIEHAKYMNEHLLTGDNSNYQWYEGKDGEKTRINASWQ